jgi:hypothetical protein
MVNQLANNARAAIGALLCAYCLVGGFVNASEASFPGTTSFPATKGLLRGRRRRPSHAVCYPTGPIPADRYRLASQHWQVQTEGLVLAGSDSRASMTLLDRVSRVNGF